MTHATENKNHHADPGRYVEQGAALMELSGTAAMGSAQRPYDAIVIGAGQAGLSVGYFLKQRGLSFLIVDGAECIGDSWRKRWDSLRLFSPARHDGLAGLRFPAPGDHFPTKDEMADYLESYARHFELPVRMKSPVESVRAHGDGYVVLCNGQRLHARQVVVAAASYQKPKWPGFAKDLDPSIAQLHSSEYQRPSQLAKGDVLVVGAGNSGAEIALDASKHHRVHLLGRDVGHVPFRIGSWLGRNILSFIVMRIVFHRVLTLSTPFGRKARPKLISQGGPLVRTRPQEIAKAGIVRNRTRIAGVKDGLPVLEDGSVLRVRNVIWCTGFSPGLSFLEPKIFDEHGEPRHVRGVLADLPGVYLVGLHFQHAMSSTMVHGMARDAEYVVNALWARARALAETSPRVEQLAAAASR